MLAVQPFRPRGLGRSVQHYAELKQEHGRVAEALARQRYAEPLDAKLIVRVPKPMLRELTAARRETAARQGRVLAAQPTVRPQGSAPAYRPRRRRLLYALAPMPL